eukprot:gene41751-55377_t
MTLWRSLSIGKPAVKSPQESEWSITCDPLVLLLERRRTHSGIEDFLDSPLGSGLGLGSETMKGEIYTVSVHFPPAVYAHLIKMAGDKDTSLDDMIRITTTVPAMTLRKLLKRSISEGRSVSNLTAYLLEQSLEGDSED